MRGCVPRALAIVPTLAAAACGSMSPTSQVLVPEPPNSVERRVEQAFATYGIPVTERAPDGRVHSGAFDPQSVWGAVSGERVSCGVEGMSGSGSQAVPFRLEVMATLRTNRQQGTRVVIESYGRGRRPDGSEVRCRLDPTVVEGLLGAVAGTRPGWGR